MPHHLCPLQSLSVTAQLTDTSCCTEQEFTSMTENALYMPASSFTALFPGGGRFQSFSMSFNMCTDYFQHLLHTGFKINVSLWKHLILQMFQIHLHTLCSSYSAAHPNSSKTQTEHLLIQCTRSYRRLILLLAL